MSADIEKRMPGLAIVVILLLLVALPLSVITYKVVAGGYNFESLVPIRTYKVTLDMTYIGHGDSLQVQTYLPQGSDHLVVEGLDNQSDLPFYRELSRGGNAIGEWSGANERGPGAVKVFYTAFAKGVQYRIAPEITVPGPVPDSKNSYLAPTASIQSTAPEITELAERLAPTGMPLGDGLQAIYDYCLNLPTVSFKGTTDALTALRLGEASCNGKSRLFVAMARSRGLPARLVGGLILGAGTKRTTHQWLEVLVGPYWVPFCPTNDHFASIPANYLRLYQGDEVLFRHTRDINFSYSFRIRPREGIRADLLNQSLRDPLNLLSVWETFQAAGIPFQLLKVLLMIPLGTLVLVILRNVIGLKTFGTFLPILVAIAARATGLYWGLAVFVLLILLVFVVRSVVVRLELLHIPQMSILLSFSVIFILALGAIGVRRGYVDLAHVSMFPIAILAITTERFSVMIEEEGAWATVKITLMTVVAIACCFLVMNAMAFQILFLTFPELVLIVVFLNIWLGRWVGLRVLEFWRFRHLIRAGSQQ